MRFWFVLLRLQVFGCLSIPTNKRPRSPPEAKPCDWSRDEKVTPKDSFVTRHFNDILNISQKIGSKMPKECPKYIKKLKFFFHGCGFFFFWIEEHSTPLDKDSEDLNLFFAFMPEKFSFACQILQIFVLFCYIFLLGLI